MPLRLKLLLALALLLSLMGAGTYGIHQYWQAQLVTRTHIAASFLLQFRQQILEQQWLHAQEVLEMLAENPPSAHAPEHPRFVALRWESSQQGRQPSLDTVEQTPVVWLRVPNPQRGDMQLAGAWPLAALLKPVLTASPISGTGLLVLGPEGQLLGSSFREPTQSLQAPVAGMAPQTYRVWAQLQASLGAPSGVAPADLQVEKGTADSLTFTRHLPAFGWTLVYALPSETLQRPLRYSTAISVAAMVLVLLSGLVMVWLLERSVLRPVKRLQEAYARLAQGHTQVRVPVQGRDELAQLSQDFNQTAASLFSAELRFRKIFEIFPHPVTLSRLLDGSFIEVNPAFAQVSGRSREELLTLSKPNPDVLGDLEHWQNTRQTLLIHGQIEKQIAQVRRPDGEPRWVMYSSRVLELDDEQIVLTVSFDVTELKQKEQAQHAQEALLREFRTMVESASDGMMLIRNGLIRDVNPAAERLFGVTPGGLAGRSPVELSPLTQLDGRSSAEMAEDYLEQTARRGSLRFEWLHLRSDGQAFTAEVQLSRVEGTSETVIAVVRDVTERHMAQRALERSEARYRQLHDNMLEGFVASTLDGRITQTNAALRNMLGYSEAQMRQLRYQDFTPAQWHTQELKVVREQVMVRGYSDLFEKEYLDAHGHTIPAEVRMYLDKDASGTPVGFWALVRDISERKQAEHAKVLQASEQRLEAVLAATGDAVWDCDLVARRTYVSPDWKALMGLPPEANSVMDAYTLENYVHPDDRARVLAVTFECLKTGHPFAKEQRMLRADGQTIWVRDRGNVVERDSRGLATRIVGSIHDITAQKTAELSLLQAKAEAEASNTELSRTLEHLKHTQAELLRSEKLAALGSLVAGVAHELNTPLGNAITVTTTMQHAQQRMDVQLQTGLTRSGLQAFLRAVEEGTDMLSRNLERAATLVSNFRQLAVDQASHQRRAFALNEAVDEVRIVMSPTLRKSSIELATDLPADLPPDLILDSYPGALTQALIIVVSNALVHAFADGRHGTVTIQAQRHGPDGLRLSVSDNGAGIAPEHLDRVFEPFFTTRLGQGGSGLGMHLLYNLVTGILGGRVSIKSTLGQGTTVHIEVPLKAPQASSMALQHWAS